MRIFHPQTLPHARAIAELQGHLRSLEKKPQKFMSSPNNEGFSSIFGHDGDFITQKLRWETTSDCGSLAKSSTFEIDTNPFTRKDKGMAFCKGQESILNSSTELCSNRVEFNGGIGTREGFDSLLQ